MAEDTHTHDGAAEVHTGHPTPMTYFKVAMILSVITAIEVAIFYVEVLAFTVGIALLALFKFFV